MFVGIIIIILLILILISPAKVDFNALQDNKDNKTVIKVTFLYGLIKFKKEFSFLEITKKDKKSDEGVDEDLEVKVKSDFWTKHKGYDDSVNIRNAITSIKKYQNVIRYSIEKIKFHTFLWKSEVGFKDAAITGIATGMINIFKSNLFTLLNRRRNKPEKIHFKIMPNFNDEVLKTNIRCIFTIKIGYIIIVRLKYLWIKSKRR